MPFDEQPEEHGGGGGPGHENLRQTSITLIEDLVQTITALEKCPGCQILDVTAGLVNFLAFKIETDDGTDVNHQEAVEAVFEMVRKVEKTWEEQKS